MSSSNETQPDPLNRPDLTRSTLLITSLLVASLSQPIIAKGEIKPSIPYVRKKAWPGGVKATDDLADDPSMPALAAIRAAGLAGAIRVPGLGDGPVEFLLRGYTPGSRATFEARAGDRHFAIKLYAEGAESEAELYEALAAAGLVAWGPSACHRSSLETARCNSWSLGGSTGRRRTSSSSAGGARVPASWPRAGCVVAHRSPSSSGRPWVRLTWCATPAKKSFSSMPRTTGSEPRRGGWRAC